MAAELHGMRTDYVGDALPEDVCACDPWALFGSWVMEAIEAKLPEPNGIVLSTVRPDGMPASRVVLMKEFSEDGIVFFTDYESDKGVQLDANPVASALLYWPGPMRQVRATGRVGRLFRDTSERYFHSRPRASQISAWSSKQSRPLGSRAQLEAEIADAKERFAEGEVPMPETWGGYVLDVAEFEFWQGMPSRAHDRVRFVHKDGGWSATRLYP